MNIFSLNDRKRLVIAGAGFAGLEVARHIDTDKYEVLLLDSSNYFTFQPLLYQVATGGLEPDSIAYPIRKILQRKGRYVLFRMATIERIDLENSVVITSLGKIPFTHLVLATGACTNFFNIEDVSRFGLSLKSMTDALDLRSFILQNFEKALLTQDSGERIRLMNFLIIGGGPTGVEIAGSLAELKKHVLPHDYPELDLSLMKITVVDSVNNVLSAMSSFAQLHAAKQLQSLGVHLQMGKQLVSYNGITAVFKDGTSEKTSALIWTAGVKGNVPDGISADKIVRSNRMAVDEFNCLPGTETIFAIGDVAAIQPNPHPMLGSVAVQQGKHLAQNLNRSLRGEWKPFRYKDRGTMATIGRSRAVADLSFIHLKGFPAWAAWLFIHLMLLVGFRNRLVVFINWLWNYFSYDKAIRLIIRPYRKD